MYGIFYVLVYMFDVFSMVGFDNVSTVYYFVIIIMRVVCFVIRVFFLNYTTAKQN